MFIERWLMNLLAGLCNLFQVTPKHLTRGRRGNQPPPEGGPGAT